MSLGELSFIEVEWDGTDDDLRSLAWSIGFDAGESEWLERSHYGRGL